MELLAFIEFGKELKLLQNGYLAIFQILAANLQLFFGKIPNIIVSIKTVIFKYLKNAPEMLGTSAIVCT